jgi:phosphopantothenoylcysteine decarboxylase/phosphopantothenate--cysteine ligase
MYAAVHTHIADADVLVMSAAVADFCPANPAQQKIKKSSDEGKGQEMTPAFSIPLVQCPDILGSLANRLEDTAQPAKRQLIRVGFAAETEQLIVNARSKMSRKRLDLLIANDVTRADSGFGSETNKVLIFHANGAMEDLSVMSKIDVAAAIWDRIVPLLRTT